MLQCAACIRRRISSSCSYALIARRPLAWSQHHLPTPPPPPLPPPPPQPTARLRRRFAEAANPSQDLSSSGVTKLLPNVSVGPSNRQNKPQSPYRRTELEQELRWLKDPLKLADHTVSLLRQDDIQKAVALVKLASKNIECIVSWNHLMDYEMSKGRVKSAVALYNDMKKRAQLPDARTFTILFRGFSWHPKLPQSLPRAISIYHSMYADNSPVKPSIIHTNAVLKVCALAGDIDALLGVAAKLPPRGNGAPNNLTFTTILNAIRSRAWEDTKGEKVSSSMNERRAQAILQGRRLWEEIRDRWIEGDIMLDEELVCAMGRLLLLGNHEKDCDDILSLLEQTMGISRQIARLGDPARKDAFRSSTISNESESSTTADLTVQEMKVSDSGSDSDLELSDPFAPLAHHPSKAPSVRPGCNTLSLTLDACIRLSLVRAAQNYWGLLTSPSNVYNIIPDVENCHMYLRLLRVQRASKKAVELVNDMHQRTIGPKTPLQTKTFRIAISCCVRDIKNRNSLAHATMLVDLMAHTLETPDAKALSMYLQVALSQQPRDWRVLLDVIGKAELGIRNIRSSIAYGPIDADASQKPDEEQVFELVRMLIGAFDIVLDLGNEGLSAQEKANCRKQRHALAAYVTRLANRRKKPSADREAKK